MRPIGIGLSTFILAAQLAAGLSLAADPATGDREQHPLAPSNIALHRGTLSFKASWTGTQGSMFNPRAVPSAVAIGGTGPGGPIALLPAKWRVLPKGRGYRYLDHKGAAGGIRRISLQTTHTGGRLKLTARGAAFRSVSGQSVTLTLTIGTLRWCAEFSGPFHQSVRGMSASSDTAPATCPCTDTSASTWAAIQSVVLEGHGCTAAACHGSAPGQGNLDLRPDVAFANLVGVPSTIDPSRMRVKRADRAHSMLWLKLAKATLGGEYANVPGTGMPFTGGALSTDELEAVRIWIQVGAPETGVVAGTASLLSTCLGPPDPIKITPPAAPAASDGVQFYAPPWTIQPRNAEGQNGEGEICHATYYDFSAQIPDSMKLSKDDPLCQAAWGGNADCFYLSHTELTQDPNSHHSIIHIYRGQYDVGTPQWESGFGPFTCQGGTRAGATCDPQGPPDQCPGSACGGRIQSGIACIGYGPPDYGFDITGLGSNNAPQIGGSQQPYYDLRFPAGVFGLYPVRGTMVWNSHAFNVTDRPTTNEQWFNVYFAKTPADRQNTIRGIFDTGFIFVQNVPPFQKVEYCATHEMAQGARVSQLGSHTHKRGVLFRIWGPPNAPCTPGPGCQPDSTRPPLATTTTYNDPVQYVFDTPLALDGADRASRSFKYCSVFDNGFTDPAKVKRRSTSPDTPFGRVGPGGPCGDLAVACLDGPHKGQLCGGNDRVCDSAPGKGDGLCDACPLRGGVTTEDEMFILLGNWYWPGHSAFE